MSGTGGVGKTSLALEVARLVEPTMADGAAFIQLELVREADAVALACCNALELLDASDRDPAKVLTDYLAPRQMVLLLDNCEHLLPELTRLIDRLLDRCPDLRLLATSRAPLRVHGEALIGLPPIGVPAEDGSVNQTGVLQHAPAVELFVERARAANPAFSFDEGSAPAIASICRRLDGLPLAIELVAAQVAALSPAEIDERLSRQAELAPIPGARPARQQTMEAALDWSYDRLDERAQVLFRQLAVFAGGWTLQAAERVCSVDENGPSITPTLVALVEHSLVVRDGAAEGNRFRMLTPVAEYAARRLAESQELAQVSLAHAQYYLAMISGGSPDWKPDEAGQLALIATEYENCLAAMRFAEGTRIVPLVVGFNVAMLRFWGARGQLHSGVRRLEAALAIVGDASSPERAFVLGGLAYYGRLLGEHERARTRAEEAERIFEAVGDARGRLTAIGILGDIAADLADYDEALAQYERVRPLVEAAGADLGLGLWHGNVGDIHRRRGDLEAARHALEVARGHLSAGPSWYLGRVLVNLGLVARQTGDLRRAAELLEAGLAHTLRIGARLQAIGCLEALAGVTLARADHGRAATLFAAATALRDAAAWQRPAHDRAQLARDLDRLRGALPPKQFEASWARGLRLSLEQAAAVATGGDAEAAADGSAAPVLLTPREREIAELVAEGLTNRQIAGRLFISPGTARIHVERILGKLGLTSRVQIATWIVKGHTAGRASEDTVRPA